MTRIVLGVIPTGRDAVVAEVDVERFKAAEAAIAEERQALLADEATKRTRPAEKPNRTVLRLGGLASGWFA